MSSAAAVTSREETRLAAFQRHDVQHAHPADDGVDAAASRHFFYDAIRIVARPGPSMSKKDKKRPLEATHADGAEADAPAKDKKAKKDKKDKLKNKAAAPEIEANGEVHESVKQPAGSSPGDGEAREKKEKKKDKKSKKGDKGDKAEVAEEAGKGAAVASENGEGVPPVKKDKKDKKKDKKASKHDGDEKPAEGEANGADGGDGEGKRRKEGDSGAAGKKDKKMDKKKGEGEEQGGEAAVGKGEEGEGGDGKGKKRKRGAESAGERDDSAKKRGGKEDGGYASAGDGGTSGAETGGEGGSQSPGTGGTASKRFQRVDPSEWLGKKGSWANAYDKHFGDDGWGAKANAVLSKVRGKDFRHEKTKKKRGSYRGGQIDQGTNSIKFDSDDE